MTTPLLVDQTGRAIASAAARWTRPVPPTTAVTTWTYEQAANALKAAVYAEVTPTEYDANRELAECHDHWRDGKGWLGPNAGGAGEVWRVMKTDIERQFTPVDVTGEALTRFANALLKTEPAVSFVPLAPASAEGAPSDEQTAEADAARRAIAAWWDRVKLWRQARTVTKRARWATRGTLRVYVDDAGMEEDGAGGRRLPKGLTLDAALARVQLGAPEPRDAGVVTDLTTGQRVAVLLYTRTEGAVNGVGGQSVNVAQLWYLDVPTTNAPATPGRAKVRDIPERGVAKDYTVDIDRLPISELATELLLTEPVRRQQARLNFSESTVVRAAETAGFRERYFLNAEPTGIYFEGEPPAGTDVAKVERDANGNIVGYLERVPPTLGAAVLNELVGVEMGPADANGKVARATPEVVIADAADPEHVLKTARHSRGTVLQSVSQGHVLRPTDQQVSGYSQEQSRADFEDDLTNTKGPLEGMLRETIEAALAWALAMVADGGPVGRDFLTRFRCVVDLYVSSGPLSDTEQTTIIARYQAGLVSRPTALALLGTEDVDSEVALLDAGETQRLDRLKRVAETMAAIATIPGGTVEGAARALKAAGIDTVLVDALLPTDADGVDDAPGTPSAPALAAA